MGNVVLVYGSLRKGFHNHRWMRGATYLGSTTVKNIRMFKVSTYPMCIHSNRGVVFVEAYEVSDKLLHALDRHEGHPRVYTRQRRKTSCGRFNGWVYLGRADQVEGLREVNPGLWNHADAYEHTFPKYLLRKEVASELNF